MSIKFITLLVSLSCVVACSKISDLSTDDKGSVDSEIYQHEHPVNPCSGAVASHTHKYDLDEEKQHEHTYECEATKPVISNAHTHEAIPEKGIRSYRHIHPNGANEHTHTNSE